MTQDEVVKLETEIRVTADGSVAVYVSRAAKVFMETGRRFVTVTATGKGLPKAVTTAELIKRRFKGLHQITELKNLEIVEKCEPCGEGFRHVATEIRNVACVEIKLSKDALDASDTGYQAPIDESLVKEADRLTIFEETFWEMVMGDDDVLGDGDDTDCVVEPIRA